MVELGTLVGGARATVVCEARDTLVVGAGAFVVSRAGDSLFCGTGATEDGEARDTSWWSQSHFSLWSWSHC